MIHKMQNMVQEADQRRMNKLKGLIYSSSDKRPKVETVMAVANWHLSQSLLYEALALEVARLDRVRPIARRGIVHHSKRKVG